jgi:hypothetical protein
MTKFSCYFSVFQGEMRNAMKHLSHDMRSAAEVETWYPPNLFGHVITGR